ncbi:MAG: hypothetical protein NW220_07490 [Leptolyngbyaceae cyanobacterium bins.349]|nr:hypothetical protein [Leptolyngbyaceae cyanobacterium bins.349]
MSSPYYRPTSIEEQQLYDHWIICRKLESPEALLERFRCLFVDGTQYAEPQILEILHKLAVSRLSHEEFKYVLNRCCRILINFWWFQPSCRWAIPELVYLLQVPSRGHALYLNTQCLRRLVREFTTTEEYKALHRLAQVVEEGMDLEGLDSPRYGRGDRNAASPEDESQQPHFIHRYPYLYPYCLGSNSGDTEFDTIRHLQTERQQKFECDLSRYVTYMVQQANGSSRSPRATAIANPTLLTDTQLRLSIKHFTGKVDRAGSYKDQALRFLNHTAQFESYRSFKEELYRYLITTIDTTKPDYGRHHFNQWLYNQLINTLPQNDHQPLSGFLITRTCHQLIETLVASPQQVNNHLMFVDLITNVGATVTTGLLLKLLLLYSNLKSSLEKRLAVLYKHYEPVMNGVRWLIESLENLQIAFSIHFGSMNLPSLGLL